jgi:hypothetical protein
MSREEDILYFMEELKNSPERALFLKLEALRASYRVFAGNYSELLRLLNIVENPEVAIRLKDVKRRAESHKVREEVTRLLHNFLASAKSLIDHMNTHMTELYTEHPLLIEYETKRAGFLTSTSVHQFVQRLRNYTQHYKLPLTGSLLSYEAPKDLTITYYLNTGELRKWKEWSPKGRKYMESFQDTLPVRKLAEDYFSLVKEFFRWLDKRQLEVNSEKLERLREIERRFARLTEDVAK